MKTSGQYNAMKNILFKTAQLFIFLRWPLACQANIIGTHRLYCMSCIPIPGDTTQLDQFRVRHRLLHPKCRMEAVECLPHQDTCVTVTMQVAPQHFWIGSGCDQRVNYDYPVNRDGCAEMPALTRNFLPGYMEERRAVQRICLCTGNLCNRTTSWRRLIKSDTILFSIITSIIMLYNLSYT